MRVAVAQFSCERDSACVEQSALSVARMASRHPELNVDFLNLKKEGGRGLHLNGFSAVAEEIQTFRLLAEEGYDWVLKLDADTLWTGASFISRLRGPWKLIGGIDTAGGGSHPSYRYIRGHGYLLRLDAFKHITSDDLSDLLPLVDQFCGGFPSRPSSPDLAWPEDEAISGIVRYVHGEDSVLGCPIRDVPTPFVGVWPFHSLGTDCDERLAQEMAARFDFIEFGRLKGYKDELTCGERRKEFTSVAMENFNKKIF